MFRKLFVCLFVCMSLGLTSSAFADYTGWYDESGWVAAEKSGLINPGEYTYRTYNSLTYNLFQNTIQYGGVTIDGTNYGIIDNNGYQVWQNNQAQVPTAIRKYAFDASGVFGWDWKADTWTQIAASDNSDFFANLLSVNPEQRYFNPVFNATYGVAAELFSWNENDFEVLFRGRDFEFSVGYYTVGDTFTVPPAGTPEPATMLIFGLGIAGLGLARRKRK